MATGVREILNNVSRNYSTGFPQMCSGTQGFPKCLLEPRIMLVIVCTRKVRPPLDLASCFWLYPTPSLLNWSLQHPGDLVPETPRIPASKNAQILSIK